MPKNDVSLKINALYNSADYFSKPHNFPLMFKQTGHSFSWNVTE